MQTNILQLGYEHIHLSGNYQFTITDEPDDDFRKYLARKVRELGPLVLEKHGAGALPLDISLDDVEGDVVAGIACHTNRGTLYLEMLWLAEGLRGYGIERRLVQMAEEIALGRGCLRARARVTDRLEFYQRIGYAVSGRMQDLRDGHTFYWMQKELTADYAVEKDLA